MTSIPKTYEGSKYVSHKIEHVPLRRSPTKRWSVEVETEVPEGMLVMPFNALFDAPVEASPSAIKRLIDSFAAGMKKRWNKRTSESDDWIEALKDDLAKAVDEG